MHRSAFRARAHSKLPDYQTLRKRSAGNRRKGQDCKATSPLYIAPVADSDIVKSCIGIDATNYFKRIRQAFRAPIGVGLEVEDYDVFARKYDSVMEDLKDKYDVATGRKCLKSHYIHEKIPSSAEDGLLQILQKR